MHVPLIRLKFYSGIFRVFRIVKNRKFRENVVTARAESIFSVYGKMFSSCVCNSATDLLQFHETDLLYWVRKFIGCAIPSDFADTKNSLWLTEGAASSKKKSYHSATLTELNIICT